ncbi:MAG: hypothetical protein KBS60_05465 [Phascolarctobacterium sp.]|nr:hypothetical protein [Candidatus Phascolarctobacterium caballi]
MFGLFKRKEEPEKINEAEETGLREYMSVDSIKAHFVDMLEENRELKKRLEDREKSQREEEKRQRKQTEIAEIAADEYKQRVREKENEIAKLKKEIDRQDSEIEILKRDQNHWKTKAEMAEATMKKAMERKEEKDKCRYWLENELKRYGNWEKLTKTQLIDIIKCAIEPKEEAK